MENESAQLVGPGMLRRIRRTADVSQRELAAMLGVSQSRVGRWEAGETSPDLETLARLAEIVGLRLALVDPDDGEVVPMAEDAVRDRAGRPFPAHLDGWAMNPHMIRFLHRGPYRTVLRRHDGTPTDHPGAGTSDETGRSTGSGPD